MFSSPTLLHAQSARFCLPGGRGDGPLEDRPRDRASAAAAAAKEPLPELPPPPPPPPPLSEAEREPDELSGENGEKGGVRQLEEGGRTLCKPWGHAKTAVGTLIKAGNYADNILRNIESELADKDIIKIRHQGRETRGAD